MERLLQFLTTVVQSTDLRSPCIPHNSSPLVLYFSQFLSILHSSCGTLLYSVAPKLHRSYLLLSTGIILSTGWIIICELQGKMRSVDNMDKWKSVDYTRGVEISKLQEEWRFIVFIPNSLNQERIKTLLTGWSLLCSVPLRSVGKRIHNRQTLRLRVRLTNPESTSFHKWGHYLGLTKFIAWPEK